MYLVFVFFLTVVCVESKGIVGKAFLCRDPDTGKLHTVNSTWPSSTFCGNYHCRLRRKNVTENEFEPIRQINFTNFNIDHDLPKLEQLLKADDYLQKHKNVNVIGINPNADANGVSSSPDNLSTKSFNEDRYLTDSEIKKISSILHSVKKSDLEAIVEIYQLAQNIYDELDKTNPETLLQETVNDFKLDNFAPNSGKILNAADTRRVSYWYDPILNNKDPVTSNKEEQLNIVVKTNFKSHNAGLQRERKVIPTTAKPINSAQHGKTVNYFDGTLSTQDFGKLPYHYPFSMFQRAASYVHQPLLVTNTPYVHPTTTTKAAPPSRPPVVRYQKDLKPSVYLPYPFFHIQPRKNSTSQQAPYSRKTYIDRYEMNMETGKVKHSNAVLINPDLENVQSMGMKTEKIERSLSKMLPIDKSKEHKSNHDWQTDPISKTILDEVRAHIDKTRYLKPLSLRKKIKLEKVGRVLKMDDVNKRNRRSIDASDDKLELEMFEVYLDKTTCQSDYSVPGFFRYGNISQPFPQCCPQRI